MSTITLPPPVDTPTDLGWVPSPIHRISLEQYEAMVESGIFTARDRIHLIKGYLVAKMTQYSPHSTADELCGESLRKVIPAGWRVRASKPIRLPEQMSEPGPDRCVVRGTIRDYSRQHSGAADVGLVMEVSDSSLREDRKMAEIYGAAASRSTGSSTWSTTRSRFTPSPVRPVIRRSRYIQPANPSRS